ncbi:alpha-amylase family glycosyl hydrolase [Komagataeibacter rhaeticus]|nr:alpha-amylase family glycosyl hydrolase [Komagataeibacter rhaeticus]
MASGAGFPLLERDRRRIELLNSLLLSMPGTPVLYYGDEIGMGTTSSWATAMACARPCSGRLTAMAGFPAPTPNAWCCRSSWTRFMVTRRSMPKPSAAIHIRC